jgi:hypothetical protein
MGEILLQIDFGLCILFWSKSQFQDHWLLALTTMT